jgi:hypothetical protein
MEEMMMNINFDDGTQRAAQKKGSTERRKVETSHYYASQLISLLESLGVD